MSIIYITGGNLDTIPESAPQYGFRTWRPSLTDSGKILSVSEDYIWRPGRNQATSWGVPHPLPFEASRWHHTGFFAMRQPVPPLYPPFRKIPRSRPGEPPAAPLPIPPPEILRSPVDIRDTIIGVVALSGQVISTPAGFRGEYAEPVAFLATTITPGITAAYPDAQIFPDLSIMMAWRNARN